MTAQEMQGKEKKKKDKETCKNKQQEIGYV